MKSLQFTIFSSQFTMRYPFSVFRDRWLTANSKHMVKGKWRMEKEVFSNSATASLLLASYFLLPASRLKGAF